jgi:hypothetical protein
MAWRCDVIVSGKKVCSVVAAGPLHSMAECPCVQCPPQALPSGGNSSPVMEPKRSMPYSLHPVLRRVNVVYGFPSCSVRTQRFSAGWGGGGKLTFRLYMIYLRL